MGSRDHSYACNVCGYERGGFNDLLCACEYVDERRAELLHALAHNLYIVGALQLAYELGAWNLALDGTQWGPNTRGVCAPRFE